MDEMGKDARIFVAGHRGLVGGAIVRNLRAAGYDNLVERPRGELDLTRQAEVEAFFTEERPEYVFLAAAKVGGIHANDTARAQFLYENMMIEANVVDAAYRFDAKKLLFLGSSCIYPKFAEQPITEEALLTGALEPTNEPYAIAKIAGLKLCENYRRQYGFNAISLMPTNLYGPGDTFDLETSHVIPALMRKAHEAKTAQAPNMTVWGTGKPRREFLHVDDLADASVFLMNRYEGSLAINVGVGEDVTIEQLVRLICEVVEYEGELAFDTSKPDGTPRKMLDVTRLHELGWRAGVDLRDGLRETYRWYLDSLDAVAAE
jgi:GDP-L-fucose synthase